MFIYFFFSRFVCNTFDWLTFSIPIRLKYNKFTIIYLTNEKNHSNNTQPVLHTANKHKLIQNQRWNPIGIHKLPYWQLPILLGWKLNLFLPIPRLTVTGTKASMQLLFGDIYPSTISILMKPHTSHQITFSLASWGY